MDRKSVVEGYTKAQILADPRKRLMSTSFVFQAGQPDWVRDAFSEAMGLPAMEFTTLIASGVEE